MKILIFPKSRAGKNTRKMPLLRNRGAERRVYENCDIWFDEKDPLIHIRTHNTDLKKLPPTPENRADKAGKGYNEERRRAIFGNIDEKEKVSLFHIRICTHNTAETVVHPDQ